MYNLVAKTKIFFIISCVIIAVSLTSLILWGLKPGIDFTGGTTMELNYSNGAPTAQEIQAKLKDLNLGQLDIRFSGTGDVVMRLKEISETVHQSILDQLGRPNEVNFETLGPTIGRELTSKAQTAVILVIVIILIYIAWSFRKLSKVIKKGESWRYGGGAILAAMHDVVVMLGLFAILGHFQGTEINSAFIVAILTVLGYSISDTIVVYDRIRENLLVDGWRDFKSTVNRSLNEVIVRSLGTTIVTVLAILTVFLFGGASIRDFALAMMVGIATGAWSSLSIATPFLLFKRK
ncbi:MAG: protein translocase subunit SecF [Candidatus Parcubacteria bacterium]|nr:protein translocase subunit SecF [Candidatus Parcubacteria bacterium]